MSFDAVKNFARFLSSYPCKEIDIAPIKDYVEKWKLYIEIAKSLTDNGMGDQTILIMNSQCVNLSNSTTLIYNLTFGKVDKTFFEYKKNYLEQFVRDHQTSPTENIPEQILGVKNFKSIVDLAKENLAIIKSAYSKYGEDKINDMVENYQTVYNYIKDYLNLKPFVERVINQNPQEPCVKNYLQFTSSPIMVINSLYDYRYLQPLLDNIEKNYVAGQNNDDFNGLYINLE